MTSIENIIQTCDSWLKPRLYKDYCPNGLQIEGRYDIKKIACAVTASQEVIDKAIEKEADLLLVHHGFFWKNEQDIITGAKKKRIYSLLNNNINLLAYHLPLDGHKEIGNNAQLGNILDLEVSRILPEGRQDSLLCIGSPKVETTAGELVDLIANKLERKPLLIGDTSKTIKNIAWCTGAAQFLFNEAISSGVDAYITGEVSEQNYHQANESGVCFIAAGHHATERYGVQELSARLSKKWELEWFFIDQNNPV